MIYILIANRIRNALNAARTLLCQVGKYFMLKAYLMQILLIMMREIVGTPQQKQQGCNFESYNKSYAVKKIVNYLNENYGQKISLDQIATGSHRPQVQSHPAAYS